MIKRVLVFISVADVIAMHDTVIEELGGCPGIHDINLLESAVNQPLIIKNHPFVDGNKRSALLTALKFLAKNGYELAINQQLYDELYDLAIATAASHKTTEEIAVFF